MTEPRFLAACRRRRVDATPVWFMRQAGRYMAEYRRIREKATILEICERPELAAEVALQPVRRLGVDAAILFADILLPARPLGLKLEFRKGEGPILTPPLRTAGDVSRLREFDPEEGLGFALEAVRLIRRECPVPLIGFAGAPFTLASYLIEGGPSDHYLHTKGLMRSEPRVWRRLMALLARVTGRYLVAQVKAGAQAVQLFDSWIGALTPEDYRRHVLPYSRLVLRAVARTGAPVIHFGTGTAGFLEDFASAGGDVIGVDWRIGLREARRRVGRTKVLQGNLDPSILASAPPAELKREVRRVLDEAGGGPHIFNLGHGILPSTRPERVRAVTHWVHDLTSRL